MASFTSQDQLSPSSGAPFPHSLSQNSGGKSNTILITPAIKKAYPDDIIINKKPTSCKASDSTTEKNNIRLLRCLECPETFHDSSSVQKHFLEMHRSSHKSISNNNGENQNQGVEATLFRCLSCNETFPCSVTLKVHTQGHHQLPNVQQFSNCPSINNNRLLSISYACQICDKSYVNRELLVEHSNGHLQGHKCPNPTCKLLYGSINSSNNDNNCNSNSSSMRTITKSNQLSNNKIVVKNSNNNNNNFSAKSNQINKPEDYSVQLQIQTINRKSEEILEPNSNKNIKISFNLSNSNDPCSKLRQQHRRKRFQCKICHKILSSKLSHEEHTRIHSGEKPYSCPLCSKTYAVKNTFRQHLATHGQMAHRVSVRVGNYKCDVCSESFSSAEKLDYHSCTPKRGESFICKICGVRFARKSLRTKHYLSHAGDSCFRCEICKDIFPDEQFYLIHAQNHFSSEIKKTFLNCQICGKRFPGKDLYERHSCRFAGVNSSG